MRYPPFGAVGDSIPITALAMPIRVFCAPPADHAAEITDPPGGPRCPVRVGAGRTGMAERLGYASQSCFLAAGLAARARWFCTRAAGLACRMSARFARAGQRSQVRRHLQA